MLAEGCKHGMDSVPAWQSKCTSNSNIVPVRKEVVGLRLVHERMIVEHQRVLRFLCTCPERTRSNGNRLC